MKKKFGRIESQSSLRTLVTGAEKLRPAERNSSVSPTRMPKRSAIQCSIETAPVTSVRKLDWDSMRPNFFFVTTPAMLESFPASYIASFHAPAGDVLLTLHLSQAVPNLTVIDVSVILRQLQLVMDQLIGAVQLVFLFALGAGVLVLYAALLATQDERTHEAAVMRALGASRAQVLAAQRAEFAVLGATAGLLGSLG